MTREAVPAACTVRTAMQQRCHCAAGGSIGMRLGGVAQLGRRGSEAAVRGHQRQDDLYLGWQQHRRVFNVLFQPDLCPRCTAAQVSPLKICSDALQHDGRLRGLSSAELIKRARQLYCSKCRVG